MFNLSLAVVNPKNFYHLSLETIIYCYISIILLMIGALVATSIKANISISSRYIANIVSISKCRITILSIISLIVAIYFGYITLNYSILSGLSAQELRNTMFFSEQFLGNPLFGRFSVFMWLIKALIIIVLFHALYDYMNSYKYRIVLITSVISMLILDAGSGGRGGSLWVIFIITSLFFITYNLSSRQYNQRGLIKVGVLIGSLGLLMIIIVSSLRAKTGHSILYSVYDYYVSYFTGPFYLFDQYLNSSDDLEARFGAFLMGFDTIFISGVARFLFNVDIPSVLSQTSGMMHYGYDVSDTLRLNANYTYLFPLYLDGGVYVLIIGNFVLGFISVLITKWFYRSGSFPSFSLLLILYIFALNSPLKSLFENPSFALVVLYIGFYLFMSKIRRVSGKYFRVSKKDIY